MSSSRQTGKQSSRSQAESPLERIPPRFEDKFTSTLADRQSVRKPETEFAMDKEIASRVAPREMTLDEFRRQALPSIRIGKLKKIQALVRGWYARKYIVPLKRINHYASYRLVEKLVEEWVELHFLPQIILEIIQQNQAYRDYSFYSPEGKILYEIADEYQNSLVHKMCEEVVRDISRSLVNYHLRKKQEELFADKGHLPQNQVATQFVIVATDTMLPGLVREVLKEMVDEYIVDVEWVKLLEFDFLPVEIDETIDSSGWEVAIEHVIDDAIEGLTMIYLMNIIEECYELEKIRLDEEAVDSAFQAVVSRCILNAALEAVMLMDDQLRLEEDAKMTEMMEVSKVTEEELDDFNMDSPSKVMDMKSRLPEKSSVKSPEKTATKPPTYHDSRSSPRREISPIPPSGGLNASKKTNRDFVDRSQLGRLLADKGWTYDPNAVSRSSEINVSRRAGAQGESPSGLGYSRRSGNMTDSQDKSRR